MSSIKMKAVGDGVILPFLCPNFSIFGLVMPISAQVHHTDRELAADIASGSRVAFGKLYARYAPALLGFILKLVPDKEAAEGILQQSFVAIWDNRHTMGPQPLFAWLLGITRSTAQSFVKNNGNVAIREATSIVNSNAPDMPPGQEKLELAFFDLVYLHGYSLDDAAELLNMKKENLNRVLRSAINNFKTRCDD